MKLEIRIIHIILLLSLAVNAFFFLRPRGTTTEIVTHTDTLKGDSIPYPVYVKVTEPVKVTKRRDIAKVVDSLYHIDTIYPDSGIYKFVDACMETKEYSDTVTDDSTYKAINTFKIHNNTLVERRFFYQRLRGDIVKTIVIQPKTRHEAWGTTSIGNGIIQVGAQYVTNRWGIGGGYEIISGKPLIQGSIKLF